MVVNTCAFIEDARQESIDTVLDPRRGPTTDDARLVVTGCMAERYGDELADALPEVDLVAGFGHGIEPRSVATLAGPAPASVRCASARKPLPAVSSVPSSTCSTCPGRRPPLRGPT